MHYRLPLYRCYGWRTSYCHKLKSGEINKEEYDRWRYRYPEFDTTGHWHKVVPSQGLSDLLVDELKKQPGKEK